MKTCIIDLETLSTKQNAVVLSLGILIADPSLDLGFDELLKCGYNLKLDIREQIKMGRHVSKSTLEWWKKQGDAAKEIITPNEYDLSITRLPSLLDAIMKRFELDPSKSHVYARGCSFDFPILENIYESMGVEFPFKWYNYRDVRTAIDIASGSSNGKAKGFVKHPSTILHNSLHDCCNDFLQMKYAILLA